MDKIAVAVAILLLMVLAGCAGIPTQRGMQQMMATWQHGNINDFITLAGPPTRVYDMPNGDKMYVFSRSETTITPVYRTPTYTTPSRTTIQIYGNTADATTYPGHTYGGQVSGGQTITNSCTINMRVDSTQRINGYNYEGNACRVQERQ